jgi:hypothetical protein
MIGELVADDPAMALRGHNLAGAQVPQRLGDGSVMEAGGDGEVGDADRPGGADADEQHEPSRIGQHGEVLRQHTNRCGIPESGDGLAGLVAVDDALVCAVGRDEVHEPQSATTEDLIIQSGLTTACDLARLLPALASARGGRQHSEAGENPALSRNGEALCAGMSPVA